VGTTSGAALRWERDLERRLPAPSAEGAMPAGASDDAQQQPAAAPDFAFAAPALHHFAAEQLQLTGPCQLVASTCASGNHALAWARDLLRVGAASAMLAVGADTIGHVVLQGFCRLLLQAPACIQPFDKHRKGTILAEGAGALLLERLSAARARGARIWAELAGCGLSCDEGGAFKGSVRDVDTLLRAGRAALRDAALAPEQIDYVSAHGSGTKLNDARETHFLHQLLGPHAASTPIGSLKSMLGHAQGAAASLEAIASVLSLHHDMLYPTINYRTPDPRCDLDCVPNHARRRRINTVLSNAFGLGGNNALVVLRRWEDA
jgi:3-oxoacyl-(acyl-carrier-protein) synthase